MPSSCVLVRGSKINNGKFDFKAAGPRWTAFRKERVLQGYHMTLTWMVSQSFWRGGDKAPAVCCIYQVDKKDFLSGEVTIVIYENHLISISSLFFPSKSWIHLMWSHTSRVSEPCCPVVVILASFMWEHFLSAQPSYLGCTFSQLQVVMKTITFNCEILLLADDKPWISWLVS